MSDSTTVIRSTGRRKEASAQVRISIGKGDIKVNNLPFEEYFDGLSICGYILQPLSVTNSLKNYDIAVTIKGGGVMGQAGAMRHGLARSLVKIDPNSKGVLKESGMLTRDSRVKERKKSGQPGARKRFQFSKR